MQLREEQQEIVNTAVEAFSSGTRRGSLLLPCGFGKTVVANEIERRVQPSSTLIVVPTVPLCIQSAKRWKTSGREIFVNFSPSALPSSFRREYGVPSDLKKAKAKVKEAGKDSIVISSFQGLSLLQDKSFDFIVVDEAHHLAGHRKKKAVQAFSQIADKVEHTLFLTGSPLDFRWLPKGLEKEYVSFFKSSFFGEVFAALSLRDAIERGLLTDFAIDPDWKQPFGFDEAQYLSDHLGEAKKTVVFKDSIAGAEDLARRLRDVSQREVFVYHSGQKTEEREENLQGFRESEDPAVLVNIECISEGVDIPDIDSVAYLTSKSTDRFVVQTLGRGLRLSPGKEEAKVFVPLQKTPEKELATGDQQSYLTSSFSKAYGPGRRGSLFVQIVELKAGLRKLRPRVSRQHELEELKSRLCEKKEPTLSEQIFYIKSLYLANENQLNGLLSPKEIENFSETAAGSRVLYIESPMTAFRLHNFLSELDEETVKEILAVESAEDFLDLAVADQKVQKALGLKDPFAEEVPRAFLKKVGLWSRLPEMLAYYTAWMTRAPELIKKGAQLAKELGDEARELGVRRFPDPFPYVKFLEEKFRKKALVTSRNVVLRKAG